MQQWTNSHICNLYAKFSDTAGPGFVSQPVPLCRTVELPSPHTIPFPQYPATLARVQAGACVPKLGCGFGQELRQLAFNGAPTQKTYAIDLSQELWDLGFELFR